MISKLLPPGEHCLELFILFLTDKISVMNESNKTTRGPPKPQPQK
jgi:hypothetical protein